MLCQNCQKRNASVHFTQVVNNKKTEMYLCDQCASEKGQMNIISPFNINSFFLGYMGNDAASQVTQAPRETVCGKCGMSFDEFRKTGKLGCGDCYEIYGEKLKPVLKRLHGSTGHTGKVPADVSKSLKASREVQHLKDLLNKAIQVEEYEKAAEIRDKIKAIENGGY